MDHFPSGAPIVATLIIILLILGAAVWLLQAISEIASAFLKQIDEALNGLGRTLFGRRGSAVLIEPPELAGKLPEPTKDTVTQQLDQLKFVPPSGSWPVWQTPWQATTTGTNEAYVSELEQLFQPLMASSPPYELLDAPVPDWPLVAPPERPTVLETHYPLPELTLPRWTGIFTVLNTFVDDAHKDLRKRHATLGSGSVSK